MISHLEYNHRLKYLKVKTKVSTSQKYSTVYADQLLIGKAFCQLEPLSTSLKGGKFLTNQ